MESSQLLPTDAELRVLRVLWEAGPQTVREVHEHLSGEKDVRYTTVLKILQNMLRKGLVVRDDSDRSHIFEAAVDEARTTSRLLDDVTHRMFAGSMGELVLRALSSQRASEEDLDKIRDLLHELEDDS